MCSQVYACLEILRQLYTACMPTAELSVAFPPPPPPPPNSGEPSPVETWTPVGTIIIVDYFSCIPYVSLELGCVLYVGLS